MGNCHIVWVDLRYSKNAPCIGDALTTLYDIQIVNNANAIDQAISSHSPMLICFDFDLPDQIGLDTIRKIKERYPSLPFLMLTDDHSTELAIWALRSRAWDYFVKPVTADEINISVKTLLKKLAINGVAKRISFMPQPGIPTGARPFRTKSNGTATLCAADYVQQHLATKISVDSVAKRCGMSKSHFSRTFKKEHGITFQDFLIQQRMKKAVELLKKTDFHVTQIALAVGYCELSNFTATFQRTIGIRPTSFRKALMPNQFND
ncbi:MAG: helix-turn-helix domain-containing protein [Candidatus Heimdallarchaeota archaeon]|nr:helix-turn-helix domain-containing protein [Candidatus Heimdallarchaeota archaeon]